MFSIYCNPYNPINPYPNNPYYKPFNPNDLNKTKSFKPKNKYKNNYEPFKDEIIQFNTDEEEIYLKDKEIISHSYGIIAVKLNVSKNIYLNVKKYLKSIDKEQIFKKDIHINYINSINNNINDRNEIYNKYEKDEINNKDEMNKIYNEEKNNKIDKYKEEREKIKIPIDISNIINFSMFSGINSNNKTISYLLVSKKHTYGFTDLVNGKYSFADKKYIFNLLRQLTEEEYNRLINDDFLTLFKEVNYIIDDNNLNKIKNLDKMEKRFYQLRENIPKQYNNVVYSYTTPDWEFPKGKLRGNESILKCARREFQEETGLTPDQYTLFKNIKPFQEVFDGTDGKKYQYTYFIALIKYDVNFDKILTKETSNIGLYAYLDADNRIRHYNGLRKHIIKVINDNIFKILYDTSINIYNNEVLKYYNYFHLFPSSQIIKNDIFNFLFKSSQLNKSVSSSKSSDSSCSTPDSLSSDKSDKSDNSDKLNIINNIDYDIINNVYNKNNYDKKDDDNNKKYDNKDDDDNKNDENKDDDNDKDDDNKDNYDVENIIKILNSSNSSGSSDSGSNNNSDSSSDGSLGLGG